MHFKSELISCKSDKFQVESVHRVMYLMRFIEVVAANAGKITRPCLDQSVDDMTGGKNKVKGKNERRKMIQTHYH